MADALQLLDNQRQTGAQVFGTIMGVMQQVNETQQQTAQLTIAAASKGFEMREAARMHDATLANMQFDNELKAKHHDAEMELMPLRVESQRLALEIQKQNAERTLKQNQQQQFNDVVAPYNARVGSTFARNQDPGYAKEYLNIQAKWRGHLAQGGKFDPEAYGRDVDTLDRNFQGSSPKDEYNPEVSYLLGELGAGSEKARYEAKNPVFKGNLLAIKSSMITGGPETYTRLITNPQIGGMFNEDETRSLSMASQAYQTMTEQIESKQNEVKRFNTAFATMADNNPAKAGIGATLEASMSELTSLRQQRQNLLAQAIDGKPVTIADQVQQQDAIGEAVRRNIEEAKERAKLVPKAAQPGEEGNTEVTNKQAYGLSATASDFPEATRGISFQHIRGLDLEADMRFTGSEPVKLIERQVRHNLDQVRDIGSLFQGEGNKKKFRELFERYKSRGSKSFHLGRNKEYEEPGIDMGISIGDEGRFESYEDLEKWMDKFEGTDNQKRLFQQDIYTSLVLADVVERSRPNGRMPLLD
jgi:hypothetical protein